MPWGLDQIPGLSADWLVRGRREGLSSEMARVLGVPDQTDWHHARTGNCGAKIAALLIAVWRNVVSSESHCCKAQKLQTERVSLRRLECPTSIAATFLRGSTLAAANVRPVGACRRSIGANLTVAAWAGRWARAAFPADGGRATDCCAALSFQPSAMGAIGDQVYWDSLAPENDPKMGASPAAERIAGKFDRSALVLGSDNETVRTTRRSWSCACTPRSSDASGCPRRTSARKSGISGSPTSR